MRPSPAVASTTYDWFGQKVQVDLKTCREALTKTALNLDLRHGGPVDTFAQKVGLGHETVHRFLRGEQIGRTSLGLILAGLGLKSEQVVTPL